VGSNHAGTGFEVGVRVVEPLGDEVLVHGSVGRGPGATAESGPLALLSDEGADRDAVTIRVDPHLRPAPGSRMRVTVATDEVHLFDGATGARVSS
jgi:hypothetical protein